MPRPNIASVIVVAWLAAGPALAQDRMAPTAVLDGPNTVPQGAALTLSATRSSDAGGVITRYIWTRVEGSGGGMTLNMPFGTLAATFTVQQAADNPLAVGRHRFQLVVEDNSGNRSTPVERAVMVLDVTAPVAVLDVESPVANHRPFSLSGARSTDAGGQVVRWEWLRVDGPAGGPMPLSQPVATAAPSLTVQQAPGSALGVGRHVFRLIVVDASGNKSSPADQSVIVADSTPPAAVLDAPKAVMQVQPFQLSAARSSDFGGRVVRYQWTRVAGSAAGPMTLRQPVVTSEPALVVAQSPASYLGAGQHRFQLVVTDDSGNQSGPVEFPVEVVPPLAAGR